IIAAQKIMSCRSEAIATYAAVVIAFVSCFAVRGQSDDHITRFDILGKHQAFLFHSHGHCCINGYRSYNIAKVCGLATHQVNMDTKVVHALNKLFAALYDLGYYRSGDDLLVSVKDRGV